MTVEERALASPNTWLENEIKRYLAGDGRDMNHPAGDDLILLYTMGRSSGAMRRVLLGSFPGDGGDRLVVASANGSPKAPSWYLNLVADDAVWIRKQSDLYEARASVMPDDERDVFWRAATARIPVMEQMQEKAGRAIPIVRLTRASD
jgi:deazaflavin-dependent oxidoreductase (nitroreductase family)